MKAVHGELIVELLRDADRALGSESSNGSFSTWNHCCPVNSLSHRERVGEKAFSD